jgi:NADH dehydrogenase
VILGGGFAGLYAARGLRRARVHVTVVDRTNHHLFQPLLYQVATAGLAGPAIAQPLRKILRDQANARVLLAEARSIDVARRRVVLDGEELEYDHLIVATGASHSYFGHEEWAAHAPGLKTLADAMGIRSRVLRAFEAAEREKDPERRRAWLTLVVVGAGPTGVELAGALAELSRHTLRREFRSYDPSTARVMLLEGAERVLPTYPAELGAKAQRQLKRLGVSVVTGARVTNIDADGVEIGRERIAARTVLWAAGVRASSLLQSLPGEHDRAGRIPVESDLTLPGHPEVQVLGDACIALSDGKPVPGVAPAAIQMGRHAARNIERALAGLPKEPFRYRDKGSLATIGRSSAVADFGRVRLSGWPAWVMWLSVHIFFLIGFRNRLLVLFEWAWAWLTFQRASRVIPDSTERS